MITKYIEIPDPLHPALVHFPIALIILATLCALIGLLPGKFFPRMTAFVLVLAAVAAQYTLQAGEDAANQFLAAYPSAEALLDEHAQWAHWTYRGSFAVALLAVVSMFMLNVKKVSWLLRLLTFVGTLFLSFSVYQTGMHGGWMVYGKALKLSEVPSDATDGMIVPVNEPSQSHTSSTSHK